MSHTTTPPILSHKHYSAGSTFTPESLLREARRQKGLPSPAVPEVCVLDPDGDIVRYLRAAGRAERHPGWACYHADLYAYDGRPSFDRRRFGKTLLLLCGNSDGRPQAPRKIAADLAEHSYAPPNNFYFGSLSARISSL
jgi:hypothetical protein